MTRPSRAGRRRRVCQVLAGAPAVIAGVLVGAVIAVVALVKGSLEARDRGRR